MNKGKTDFPQKYITVRYNTNIDKPHSVVFVIKRE